MENNERISLTNDEIRNRHYLDRDNKLYELQLDLKKKLRRLYIIASIIFVLICVFLYLWGVFQK